MPTRYERAALLAILGLALALRLKGLAWGLPHAFHPDEGSILTHALGFGTGDLNPHWFRWPSLQMYLMFVVYGLYFVFGRVTGLFRSPQDLMAQYITDLTPFWYLGRLFSALAGVATVYLVYRLARRLFGAAAGLVAAALLAVTYLHVRDSHYATPDVFMTLLMVLSFDLSTRIPDAPTARHHALAGLFAGLAASTKYVGGMMVCVPIFVADLLAVARRTATPRRAAGLLLLAAVVSVLGFVAGTPYSVLDFPKFSEHFFVQSDMMSLDGPAAAPAGADPFEGLGVVFARTLPNGLGWPLYLAASFGLLGSLWWWRGRGLLLLSYVVPYLVVFCVLPIKRATYFTPLTPVFAIGGALALLWLHGRLRSALRPAWAPAAVTAVALATLALPTLGDSLRYARILGEPDTRMAAKAWIEGNLPAGTDIATDQYGPPLNPSVAQLMGLGGTDTTTVGSWSSHQSALNRMRFELLARRQPQFDVFELPATRAALAWGGIEAMLRERPRLEYIALSSKHVGCAGDLLECVRRDLPAGDWALEPVKVFQGAEEVPVLDNPPPLTFHNPNIALFRVTRPSADGAPPAAGGAAPPPATP